MVRFSDEVMRVVATGRGMRVLEAVIAVAEREGINPELAATILTPDVIDKLQDDAEKHRMIKKSNRLRFV